VETAGKIIVHEEAETAAPMTAPGRGPFPEKGN
jgi:hypothetical protein